ncbi:MATE family efflux transporter [Empedobacter falsenii]|uniref:Lipopolysaccharide biosynthesis protein n=1 Tax=Empedobacter falsenii TaxID=343874 RepID=A0A3R8TMW4_9FLAO|nr:MATE family efflux transporter [Empedobacter falsenii]RRT93463.1 lipopolysaccharide biosynthesis protein [Empedobacter falsenii]RRT93609.1 lipopolysaccharide biosynthesis protein [Empedobacter falsenii]
MSSNKTIAKNTLFLYFRLLFTLGIGLFTSRVVLQVLGVEDFGIYNVVGGVVVILSFLQGALSGATTRFLNVGMVGEKNKLQVIFNTALILHIFLAIVVLFLAETIGLWFFYNKLNIPFEREQIAFWVYQISVLSIIFTIVQIPYNAAIIAHEKMNIYALISIIEAILKLIIIYIVSLSYYDKLLFYAILVLIVSIVIRFAYLIYCKKNFSECKFNFLFDKKIFNQMLSFFGWDLYGNMSVAVNIQGFSIVQNLFFGPIINSSIAIVSQLQGGIASLGNNFTFAVKPQLIQSFVKEDFDRMKILLSYVTRFSFFLMLFICMPIAFNSEFILKLWLHEIPPFAETFLTISLICGVINLTFAVLVPIIHATGKLFLISFVTGSIYLLNLPLTYLILSLGFDPTIPYYSNILIAFLTGFSNLFIVNKYIPELNIKKFIIQILFPLFGIYILIIPIFSYATTISNIHPMLEMLFSFLLLLFIIYFILINKNEKILIKEFVYKKIKKNK